MLYKKTTGFGICVRSLAAVYTNKIIANVLVAVPLLSRKPKKGISDICVFFVDLNQSFKDILFNYKNEMVAQDGEK